MAVTTRKEFAVIAWMPAVANVHETKSLRRKHHWPLVLEPLLWLEESTDLYDTAVTSPYF